MKKILFLIALLYYSNNMLFAQQPNIGCVDKVIKLQAEDFHQNYAKQSMSIYRDAMLSMSSNEPFPIEVQLNKGVSYQLIFIGSKESSKIKMELFDGDDKKISTRDITPNQADKNSNCIIFSFVPTKTDLYLVVLNQKCKSKNMCGSFTIMEKGNKKEATKTDTVKYTRPTQVPVNNTTQPVKTNTTPPVKNNPRYVPVNK